MTRLPILVSLIALAASAGTPRQEFVNAVATDPATARAMLPQVISKPWAGQVSFLQALEVAKDLPSDLQRRFLLAAARHNPSVTVRDIARYAALDCAAELFEAAALLVPDDAVAAASGRSASAERVAQAIRASGRTELRRLAALLDNSRIDDVTRQRAAVFVPYLDPSFLLPQLPADASYFRSLADARIAREKAPVLDRAMETFAQTTLVSIRDGGPHELNQLKRYAPRDLYLLLTYGRTEGGAGVFAKVYDQFLSPRLRGTSTLEAARYLGLRHFLSLAVAQGRFEPFLRALGPRRPTVLALVIHDLHKTTGPLEEVIATAEVVDALTRPAELARMSSGIRVNHARATDKPTQALYGMLAVRLSRRIPGDTALATVAEPYRSRVRETRSLNASSIYSGDTAVIRYLFWNDDDGVESFQSFKQAYAGDPRWRIRQDDGGFVHLTGRNAKNRKIELFANIPADILSPANRKYSAEILARQDNVTRALADRKLQPLFVVHRGHSYHLEKSLPYFTADAKLVYLGSCNGMDKMAAVTERARSAQIIATRGVGTMAINDPILKAINDELLDADRVDWDVFWRALEKQLGVNGMFRDYIGPHQNAAASLLAAYYEIVGPE